MALQDSLIAYWKLNEESGTRTDSHASNDLSDQNTVLYGTGILGNAGDFETSNDEHLLIADNADLSFGDEDFSIIAWVKLETETQNAPIVAKWEYGNNDREYTLRYLTATDIFEFRVSHDGTNSTGRTSATFGNPGAATWYMLFGAHDSSNNLLKISVDDGTVDTTAYASGCNDNISPFCIGGEYNSGSPGTCADALIDEVGIWGRVLTSAEITELYNSGSGITYPFPQSLAGPFVSTGTVTKETSVSKAGPLVMTGAVAKKAKRALAGPVTFTGTVLAKAKKALAGAITFSGTSVLEKLRKFFARFRDYTFAAPQRFTIVSNAAVFNARYRDYTFNAPKREDMATAKDVWLEDSPFYLVEGAAPKLTVVFNWASTITGTPTIEVYKDGGSTDAATTYLTAGSATTSGASLTTTALKSLVPGKYVIVYNAVVDGVTDVWKQGMVVQKQEALW